MVQALEYTNACSPNHLTRHPIESTFNLMIGYARRTQCDPVNLLQAEVQTVTTQGGADGSFTLAFGALDYALPGTVDAVNGVEYLVTSQDLTPYVKRGDRVSVEDEEYAVHAFRPFNATHLYLAKVPHPMVAYMRETIMLVVVVK